MEEQKKDVGQNGSSQIALNQQQQQSTIGPRQFNFSSTQQQHQSLDNWYFKFVEKIIENFFAKNFVEFLGENFMTFQGPILSFPSFPLYFTSGN